VVKGRTLFCPSVLSVVIDRNLGWLQTAPRSSLEVLATLFPSFEADDMTIREILTAIGDAMFSWGYAPSEDGLNPSWMFPV